MKRRKGRGVDGEQNINGKRKERLGRTGMAEAVDDKKDMDCS
jgi:hypothetical protein